MPTKLKPIQAKRLLKILQRLGFTLVHVKGSHHVLRHSDGRMIVVPVHSNKPIGVGLLNEIIKEQLKMPREDFLKLL